MRVNEFPKEYLHKKIFLCSSDNILTYFQKNQTVYYIFPECIPDLSCCAALFMLTSSTSLFLQSYFFKSHPSLEVGLNVTSFMESSMISALLKIIEPLLLKLQIFFPYSFYCIYYILSAIVYFVYLPNCVLKPGDRVLY